MYYKKEFVILYDDDVIEINLIDSENFIIQCGEKIINLNDITCFWHRTAFHNFNYKILREDIKHEIDISLFKYLHKWTYIEERKLYDIFNQFISKKRYLSTSLTYDINRIEVLYKAKELGLDVPDWIISTLKKEVEDFYKKHLCIITKTIGWNVGFEVENNYLSLYTNIVEKDVIDKLPTTFTPSFFQKTIKKKYEIRAFYLDGKFYSMAAISEKSNEEIDSRANMMENYYRKVPYKLPKNIESKLKALLCFYKLKTASIDIIKGVDNIFYFLEINPTGQFNILNVACNYPVEKNIANFLIEKT